MSWTVAGAVAGGAIGSLAGGVGITEGAQIGATIGSLIDAFSQRSPASMADRRYSSCSYGTPINRVWGSARVDCQIVWVARNSDGTYMHEVDEFKKSGTEQHWFATFACLVAETGFTFPDGSQIERPLTIDMIWMADLIMWTNPATVTTIPNWSGTTAYNFGDDVHGSDGRYYSSLADNNYGINPAGLSNPAWWQAISFVDQKLDFTQHPGTGESTFTQASDSTISAWAGGAYVPSMRGNTYFVALNTDLYNIGNAIPQNVSVSCHTAAVTDAEVLSDICRMCGVPQAFLDFSGMTNACTGFVLNNRVSGKEALTNYCIAQSIDLIEIDGMLSAVYRGGPSVVTIPDADMGAALDGKEIEDRLPVETLADFRELHSSVAVRYRSASQWYRQVDVLSLRGDVLAENPWIFDSGLTLSDDSAAQLASMLLDIEWLEAGGRFGPLKLSDEYAYLAPACPILANDNGVLTRFRVTEMDWIPGQVSLILARDELEVLSQNASGDSGLSPILPGQAPVAGFVVASPSVDATSHLASFPGFYIWLSCLPTNARCTVWYSFDGFTTAGVNGGTFYQSNAVFGLTSGTALAAASGPGYEDVSLTDFTYLSAKKMDDLLVSTTQHSVQNGAQWGLIGQEWVGIVSVGAPGSPQQIGPGLIRGLRGSPTTGHAIGEQFAACSLGSLIKIQVDPSYIGQTVYVQVLTPGQQLGDSVVKSVLIQGPTSMTPVNPSAVSAGAVSYSGLDETVVFSAILPAVPPAGQAYNWQSSTDGGSTWSGSVVGGLSFVSPVFSAGTMKVRVQAALSDGIVGAWVESSSVTYSRPSQHVQETPAGVVDGSNAVFTLSYAPVAGTLQMYVNGLLATNYTFVGETITFSAAPLSGASLFATYSY